MMVLGSMWPLKMDGSIYKNTGTSGCLSLLQEDVEKQRVKEERKDKRTKQ